MRIKDLTGQKFGRLTAVEETGRAGRNVIWLCRCECGNFTEVVEGSLVTGRTRSCGCLRIERARDLAGQKFKHRGSTTKLYSVWSDMKSRCYRVQHKSYKYYGGRGIKVCDEWREDFSAFRDFALAHGYREGLSIDRKDNDGDYGPSNVQFITRSENTIKRHGIKSKATCMK